MSRKSKSKTARWVEARGRDAFWRDARKQGYRSRAAYKLAAIDDAFRILKPGLCVVDLGCAPGGWGQVLVERCRKSAAIVGVDLLEMNPVDGVTFVRGDFCEQGVVDSVLRACNASDFPPTDFPPPTPSQREGRVIDDSQREGMVLGDSQRDVRAARVVDVVVSDMSPNLSGVAATDQANAGRLVAAAAGFARANLKAGGAFVVKCFAGADFDELRAQTAADYGRINCFRPPATRAKSREAYLVGRDFCLNAAKT